MTICFYRYLIYVIYLQGTFGICTKRAGKAHHNIFTPHHNYRHHNFFRPHLFLVGRCFCVIKCICVFPKTSFFFKFRQRHVIQYDLILKNKSIFKSNLAQNENTYCRRTIPIFRPDHTLFCYFLILLLNCNF